MAFDSVLSYHSAMLPPGMTLIFTGQPITDADLARLEAKAGARLPDDYRAFMLAYNGGRPQFEGHPHAYGDFDIGWLGPVRGYGGDKGLVGDLFSIAMSQWNKNDLSDFNVFHLWGEEQEPRVVSIGYDPGGNPILLALSGKLKGKILFTTKEHVWHALDMIERLPDARQNPDRQVGVIGENFTDFLYKLVPFDD